MHQFVIASGLILFRYILCQCVTPCLFLRPAPLSLGIFWFLYYCWTISLGQGYIEVSCTVRLLPFSPLSRYIWRGKKTWPWYRKNPLNPYSMCKFGVIPSRYTYTRSYMYYIVCISCTIDVFTFVSTWHTLGTNLANLDAMRTTRTSSGPLCL